MFDPDSLRQSGLRWVSCLLCSRPAFRTLGAEPFCEIHLAEFLDPILARIIADETRPGWGVPLRHRPDHGPDRYDLECVQCHASWTAQPGAVCPYCASQLAAVAS